MLRERVSVFLMFAVVLVAIAPVAAVAETIGSSNYATAVAATNPDIYLRLSEPAGIAVGDAVVNDGTLGTAGLGGTWGVPGYTTSSPVSGAAGPNSAVIVNGHALLGLESDNTAALFTGRDEGESDILNLNPSGATSGPAVMDQEGVTYSMWFTTTSESYYTRIVTSHPANANRFGLMIGNGMLSLVTNGGTGMSNTAEPKDALGDSITFNDGTWHHLVAIQNGDDAADAQLYIDGEEIALTARNGSWNTGYALRVGSKGTGTNYLHGTLDEIAMWGRALSDEEAMGLFDAATVPEPSVMVLLGTLLAAGLFYPRRKA